MDLTALGSIGSLPPNISKDRLSQALLQHYQLAGELTPLVSERDQNFRLRTAQGDFLLKVANRAEPAAVTDMQIAVLAHLEAAEPGLSVARIVTTVDNRSQIAIDASHRMRLLTWVAGEPLQAASPTQANSAGRLLARLAIALQEFRHAGETQELLWDIRRAEELRALTRHIDDALLRTAVERAIDDFTQRVQPELATLRHQVIHNDANPGNLLSDASGDVSGIIDFGDMMFAPLIIDVAVAASYFRANTEPLSLLQPFVAGYNSVKPLLAAETEVLFELVRARLATTVTLLHWRLADRSDDDAYRQKALANESSAGEFLRALDRLGRTAFLRGLQL